MKRRSPARRILLPVVVALVATHPPIRAGSAVGPVGPRASTETAAGPTMTYVIDPAGSRVRIQVYKAGWLKGLGHDHRVEATGLSGAVEASGEAIGQAAVRLELATDSLTVVDPDLEPDTRAQVQHDMQSEKVLHVSEYPRIRFTSTSVTAVQATGDGIELTLSGDLTLHGVTRRVSVPVTVAFEQTGLRARGTFRVLQSEYGIEPVRVRATLGGIRVRDEVEIDFDIVARPGD